MITIHEVPSEVTSAQLHKAVARLVDYEIKLREAEVARRLKGAARSADVQKAKFQLEGFSEALSALLGWSPFKYSYAAQQAVTAACQAWETIPPVGHRERNGFTVFACLHVRRELWGLS